MCLYFIYKMEQGMSNKKLFGVAFFTLSCCEFGQFVYSKNSSVTAQETQIISMGLHCTEEITLRNALVINAKSPSYSLPR